VRARHRARLRQHHHGRRRDHANPPGVQAPRRAEPAFLCPALAARLDAKGAIDKREPVEGFWRKFNIDGSKQPLNFIERAMAYGVKQARTDKNGVTTFTIAALPERRITLNLDASGKPQALMQAGKHMIKLSYVYLHVVEGGLMPEVPKLDIFGTDIASGRAIHEHLVQK
jgi:hypothetical protein